MCLGWSVIPEVGWRSTECHPWTTIGICVLFPRETPLVFNLRCDMYPMGRIFRVVYFLHAKSYVHNPVAIPSYWNFVSEGYYFI